MVRATIGVQLKGRKRSTYLMFMLDLNETIDEMAMANSVCWHGNVLTREGGHVLRRVVFFKIEDCILRLNIKGRNGG